MVGELLDEIMNALGVRAFNFDLGETTARTREFLESGKYFVLLARAGREEAALLTLYESYALYAEGAFGTIPELYVRPAYRSKGVGRRLVAAARELGAERGWKRLEVTTPPLPAFDRTLKFYERAGFSVTGGRKLKTGL